MSQIYKGILGALAVLLTGGAAQFASGQDLAGLQAAFVAPETGINRAAKADRAAVPASPLLTHTIAFRVDGVADTSVLVRVRVPTEPQGRPANSLMLKSGDRKTVVACEPVVSVLTEVAKLLQPGRCVA